MSTKQKRWWKFLLIPFLVISFASTLVIFNHNSAYADYTISSGKCDDGSDPASTTGAGSPIPILTCKGERKTDAQDNKDTSADEETCAVDKIGWILCPIIEQSAVISDKAFKTLADNFLRTDPQLFNDKSGTKAAWEIARNIANIMFVIAFLVIIISQVTSYGISNYGIKKMLPRLIVAALAVNVSYYICQLVVDITNILGYEIQNTLAGISNSLGPSVFGSANNYGAAEKGGGILTVLAVGILATAAIVWVLMAQLGAIVMLAIITVVSIIIILLLRKAIIVLLIVVSPIAFVLYLLPNTEKFFSKWLSMFGKILMVFPVVGLLFGAGQLASTIILVSGAQNDQMAQAAKECNPDAKKDDSGKYTDPKTQAYYDDQKSASAYNQSDCGGGAITLSSTKDDQPPCKDYAVAVSGCKEKATVSWSLGLIAMGIAVAPLIAVWAVLKGALSAAGAIGGKITSAVSKGVAGAGNGAAGWATKNTAIGRGMAARKAIKQNYKDQKFAKNMTKPGLRGAYTRTAARGFGGNIGRIPAVGGALGAQNAKLSSNFAGAAQKIEDQEISEMGAVFEANNLTNSQLKLLANGGSVNGMSGGIAQKAAIKAMVEQQDIGAMEDISKSKDAEALKYLARQIDRNYGSVKQKAVHMVQPNFIDDLKSGKPQTEASLNTAAAAQIPSVNPELLASQKTNGLKRMRAHQRSGGANSAAIISSAQALRGNSQLFDKMSPADRALIERIAADDLTPHPDD